MNCDTIDQYIPVMYLDNQRPHLVMIKLKTLILFIGLSILSIACNNADTSVNTQGMFEFPEELVLDEGKIPDYLDAEKILCNGKGLRVGKCISDQLKKGICLGIIKHEKRVYAIEIPCDDIKKPELDSLMSEEEPLTAKR